ncbi:MAG: hypothetical protein ABL857_05950 [Rickettsiales bacterium]|jgi:hypothetical protein
MPTERPRIQVTLDTQTNSLLAAFAGVQERSISSTAADLIKEALELHEDVAFSKLADKRLKETKEWVSHEKAWS